MTSNVAYGQYSKILILGGGIMYPEQEYALEIKSVLEGGGWPCPSQSFGIRRVPRPSSAWAGSLTSRNHQSVRFESSASRRVRRTGKGAAGAVVRVGPTQVERYSGTERAIEESGIAADRSARIRSACGRHRADYVAGPG